MLHVRRSVLTSFDSDLCISFPVIYFFFPETKQKSLEQIDLLFGGHAAGALPEEAAAKQRAINLEDLEKQHTEEKV